MTKRIESEDMDIDACAAHRDEGDGVPATIIWKWNTPEEASAFLEGVDSVYDEGLTAWIDEDDPTNVLICEHDFLCDFDGCPRVRFGGES